MCVCIIQNTTAGNFIPSVYENGARTTEIPFPPSLVFDCSYEIHILQHDDCSATFLDVMNSTIQNTTAGNCIPAVYENGARTTEIPFPPSLVFDCSYEIHIFQHENYVHFLGLCLYKVEIA